MIIGPYFQNCKYVRSKYLFSLNIFFSRIHDYIFRSFNFFTVFIVFKTDLDFYLYWYNIVQYIHLEMLCTIVRFIDQ